MRSLHGSDKHRPPNSALERYARAGERSTGTAGFGEAGEVEAPRRQRPLQAGDGVQGGVTGAEL